MNWEDVNALIQKLLEIQWHFESAVPFILLDWREKHLKGVFCGFQKEANKERRQRHATRRVYNWIKRFAFDAPGAGCRQVRYRTWPGENNAHKRFFFLFLNPESLGFKKKQ